MLRIVRVCNVCFTGVTKQNCACLPLVGQTGGPSSDFHSSGFNDDAKPVVKKKVFKVLVFALF